MSRVRVQRWSGAAALCLVLLLAARDTGPSLATAQEARGGPAGERAAPPGPGPRGPAPRLLGPEEIDRLSDQVIGTLKKLVQHSSAMLETQRSVLDELAGGREIAPDDPRLGHLRQMAQGRSLLEKQMFEMMRRLPPPEKLPPRVGPAVRELREKLLSVDRALRESSQEIRERSNGSLDLPEQPEPGEGGGEGEPPAGEEPAPGEVPRTAREVGERIEQGSIRTPKNLLEAFMGIPQDELPRGNLDAYRNR